METGQRRLLDEPSGAGGVSVWKRGSKGILGAVYLL